jgi:2-polyprenyl-3-methyl-5-hydroxy-6-metoxy-1,4-benzoquinol methylase
VVLEKLGRLSGQLFQIVSCSRCHHIRTDPRISDEELGSLYDEQYYKGEGFDPAVNYEGTVSQWTVNENAGILATVRDALDCPLAGARWLDLGCGTGTLVAAVRAAGADGVGFDDSAWAMASCRRKGVPTLEERELITLRGTFDVVSAVEVIEHVADPVGLVRAMTAYVRPGGVVYVHTENWNVVRHLPGRPYIMPEGHIQYFTPQAMRRILTMCELREAPIFNRSWFVWRRLPLAIRSAVPESALPALSRGLVMLAPGFAPFPVGLRTC